MKDKKIKSTLKYLLLVTGLGIVLPGLTFPAIAQDSHKHEQEHEEDKTHEHHNAQTHADHGANHNKEAHQHAHVRGEADGEHGEHAEAGFVKLTPEQLEMAGIKVATIKAKKNVYQTLSAPGEVVNDLYKTTLLTTQVDSKVIQRKVVLGQHVQQNAIIAVLYSRDIATAQNQLRVSLAEWQRVKNLGKQTVGAKRFINAKADFDKNKSLLASYGMPPNMIRQLVRGKNAYPLGQYPVVAPHSGVIIEDNFQSGQFLPAGATIALLVNEDDVWVEALLAPQIGQRIPVGTKARVVIGGKTFMARVIQDSHAIDEVTRTRKIRLQIKNTGHLLHAGLFAQVFLQVPVNPANNQPVILLPETALMRSADGDWAVFIQQQAGVFKQQEVELINTINGLHSIQGLEPGQKVAIEGAFFLASEMAKSGFDPHNH